MPVDDRSSPPYGQKLLCSEGSSATQTAEAYQHTGNDLAHATAVEARRRPGVDEVRTQPICANRGFRDITAEFAAASTRLPAGELVKDEYFTLFEAVGALEIMNPKMDSGFVPPGDSFEPDFDVCAGLSTHQVVWIMDELFRLEMSFHDGYPLSQNIYTSLHIMRLIHPENKPPYRFRFEKSLVDEATTEDLLVHVVLRAYCIAVVKSVQLTLSILQAYTFYQEEDFVTDLFGRELLPRVGVPEALKILNDAHDWLSGSDLPAGVRNGLGQRLSLREHLLLSLDAHDEQAWVRLQNEIRVVDAHHDLAQALPGAFSDKVQRQLATSSPPRPMPTISWPDACQKWQQLCDDVLAAFRFTSAPIRASPYCLQRATWAFAYRTPAPSTFARAKMQDVLTRNDTVSGELSHSRLILADIREFVLAGDPRSSLASFLAASSTDPGHTASRLMEDFMQRTQGEYINLYRMLCQNRCRMRRTFTQAVPILDEIESEAREVDRQLNVARVDGRVQDEFGGRMPFEPLRMWTRNHKLQIMEWVIQLGFETDLYLAGEMCMMYQTLHEIMGVRCQQLLQLQEVIRERLRQIDRIGEKEYYAECQASQEWIQSLWLHGTATQSMSVALCDLYGLLEHLAIIGRHGHDSGIRTKGSEPDFLRYEARMKPLLGLEHEKIADFRGIEQRKRQAGANVGQTFSRIDTSFKQARGHLGRLKAMSARQAKYVGTEEQWTKEMKGLERTCVAGLVAGSQLQRICQQTQAGRQRTSLQGVIELVIPPPGQRYHEWWVVPQVKERG